MVLLDTSSGISAEGYALDVSSTISVTASDVDGLLYGFNALLKHFRNAGSNTIQGFTSADAPDTVERTVHLDCARKYYTKEWICNFIRQISWMGYNTIELHFSEDGGFRADFWDPEYYTDNYNPANDFSWLCGSYIQSWVNNPYRTDPDAGKYLTTAELVEILKVAKEYHIDVIPSFDSPAHMDYIAWKFEQNYKSNTSYSFTYDGTTYKASSTSGCINYTGVTGASSPTWPYYTTIDITDDMAKAFVFALYADIAAFFKEYSGSTDFAIGADEVVLSSYYGTNWEYSDFPGYINDLNRMLNSKGYTCRMFNDFIGSTTYNQDSNAKAIYDFDDNIEIMYWNSDFDPTEGTWSENIWHVMFFWENNDGSTNNWGDGGRTLYNCIQTNCYYVLRVAGSGTDYPNMDARNPENYNWAFYGSNEEDIYNDWYPADISEKGLHEEDAADVPSDQLGGAYFLIWNDYAALNTEAEVWNGVKDNTGTSTYTYSLFDRMWSNITKMWNWDINDSLSYDDFAEIRDTLGDFPGLTSCSAAAELPAATAPTSSHTYSMSISKEPTCTDTGTAVYTCTACGDSYEDTVAMTSHSYDIKEVIEASCLDFEKVRYTCSVCGDSYTEYSDGIKSDWQTTKPEGVDDSLIETKTQYRYSDYETITSYDTSLDGYDQLSSTWEKTGTGTVQYVNSWPSGFSTSSSLYTKYNNKSNKVSASVTTTDKTVINSDELTGYLYYHWCYSGSYYSYAYTTGSYTTFHAYYSTTAPSNYICDTSDYSYCTAHSTCSNSDWFFVANVYTQSYTKYKKLFTYERWTDWSDWSDTAYTASDTRKVETQTLYRYADGTLGDHVWDEGVCSVCKKVCDHAYQNNVCTVCGMAKPDMDYYLFGYINGANYACEEDSENLGEYKFDESGTLVVSFTADSYVGVKASDNQHWYMTEGWQGKVTSAALYNTTKLTTADKLYVPGGTKVTFTLKDNGDDTYVLSYTAVCNHESHDQDGICENCGETVRHTYQNNICTVCGAAKPVQDYYLFGYINGANYACEEDSENLGEYKFVDGSLVVFFTDDSYVAVKAADNKNWYMTDSWQGFVSSVTLYNNVKLTTPDKMYVPGGTEVTFTLVDNGDDTYVLSYVAVECSHEKHDTNGVCTLCGDAVEHTYDTTGFCSCGLECEHTFKSGICEICGMACGHSYKDNVCQLCGLTKPVLDYYLFGYINGADYACEADFENLGEYKFVDGSLVAFFEKDSYVAVKASDNQNWYMTAGYQGDATSVTLYNTKSGVEEADKLFVPGSRKVTFTLVDNGDDTYVLSYVAVQCPHDVHDTDGVCALCGNTVTHTYDATGFCSCGLECQHNFKEGACSICGVLCQHNWNDGACTICHMVCEHDWDDGACTICKTVCGHSWIDGVCSICTTACGHSWADGSCTICHMSCDHSYVNNICTTCGMAKPTVDYYLFGLINGENYACEEDAANLGEYKFVDGKLTAVFTEDSYVGVKASNNAGWYMTDGDQGEAASAILYNTADISDGAKLYVPGRKGITFTLVDNGDDTLTLSYEAAECPHENHSTDGSCTICGAAVGHVYVDGVCSVCGAAEPAEPAELFYIDGAAMTLGNSLAINFFIEPTDLVEGETYYAVITKEYADGREDAAVTVEQSDWSWHEGYEQYYVTFDEVAAKEMSDKVTVAVYNSKNEAVSYEWVDSVRDYTMRVLTKEEAKESPDSEKLALYVDMLNYGAAAQSYFGDYHADDLANSQLTEAQKGYATAGVTMEDHRVKGNGYNGSTLTLESEITLNFFFLNTVVDQEMYAVAAFTDHYGTEKSVRVEGSEFCCLEGDTDWYVPVTGMVVADGRQLVTVTIYDENGNEVTSATDSIESYVARMSSSNALYECIMKFATSAYAYFH